MNAPTLLLTYTATGSATSWTTGAATAPTTGKYVWLVVSIGRGAGATDVNDTTLSGLGASSFIRVADTIGGGGDDWRTIVYRAVGANATTAVSVAVTSSTHSEVRIQAFETDPAVAIQSRSSEGSSTSPSVDLTTLTAANQVIATLQLQAAPTVTPEAGLTTLQTTGTTQTLSTIYGDGTEDANLSITLGSSTTWFMSAIELAPLTQSPTRTLLSYSLTNAGGQSSFTTHAGETPTSGQDVFAVVTVGRAAGAQALSTVSGFGATWTEIADHTPSNTDDYRVKVYRLTGSLDGSAVTFTTAVAHTEGICQIFETDPVDFLQAAYSDATSGTTPSVTMSAFGSDDSLVLLITTKTTTLPPTVDTPEAGLSLLVQSGKQQIVFGDGTEDTTLTSTLGTSSEWLATGLEFGPAGIPDDGGVGVGDGDTTTEVGAGFGSDPFGDPTYTDISTYIRGMDFGRGRSSVFQTFDAGTATLVLDNRDGRFDPGNTAGPYYPNVAVGTPIRIRLERDATTAIMWVGNVDRIRLEYPGGGHDAVAIVEASENIGLLVRHVLSNNYAAADSADRVDDVLDEVGWPTSLRQLSTSSLTSVPAVDYSAEGVSRPTAWNHINDVVLAEQGAAYVNKLGELVFEGRVDAPSSSSATFGVGVGEYPYQSLTLAYDNDLLINRATALGVTGGWQTADDTTSQGIHGIREVSYDLDTLSGGPAALNLAQWTVLRYGTVRQRVTSITINPDADPDNLWPFIRDVELRDVITVKFATPGAGDDINQVCRVEWLRHSAAPGQGNWVLTLGLLPVPDIELEDFFTLDVSELDSTDVLA